MEESKIGKIMEKVGYHRIQEYFVVPVLNAIDENAYKRNHSNTTAL